MKNVLYGIGGGGSVGSLIALIVALTRAGEENPVSLLVACSIYIIGGMLGGAIAGGLARWVNGWFRAGLIGVLSLVPIAAMFTWLESVSGNAGSWIGVLVVAFLVGFPVGVIYHAIIKEVDPFGPLA